MEVHTLYLDKPIMLNRAIDVVQPQGIIKPTALFYVHGGGWSKGSRDSFHHHLEHFSAQGYPCASGGYRLAPSANWREQLLDVMEGYDRFIQLLREQHASISRVIVLGSSAGAHLASLLALMHPDELGADRAVQLAGDWRAPDACVSINGPGSMERWPDMDANIRESIQVVVGCDYDEDTEEFARTSPDRYVRQGGPDFLFQIVELEKFFPHELVYAMSEKIIAHGAESRVILYEGAEHGFFYRLTNPIQKQALHDLEAFVHAIDLSVVH